jgi:AraC-like DNA-binding protein/ligand-binding sensor protein
MSSGTGLKFEDISKLTVLKEFYKLFFDLTGLVVDYNSVDGQSQMAYSTPDDLNPFCRIVRSTPEGYQACVHSACIGGKRAYEQGKAYVYECHAGLIDIAVPVVIRRQHVANIAAGQILLERPTALGFQTTKERLAKLGEWDWAALENCYYATRVITSDRLQSIIKLLELVAGYVFEQEDKLLLLQRENEQQSIRIVKNHIADHYMEPVSLDDLAAAAHMSACYLSKLFKQETGQTISDYITSFRIAKAKNLLCHGERKIIEIANLVGYESPSHFSRVFKQYEGRTPSEYRKGFV